MMTGALVLPEVIVGMIEASTTRRSMPRTRRAVLDQRPWQAPDPRLVAVP
jgi:hypothetical protein